MEIGGSSGPLPHICQTTGCYTSNDDFHPAVRTWNIITNFSVRKFSGRFAVLRAMLLNDKILWYVAIYRGMSSCRHFERSFCLRLQYQEVKDYVAVWRMAVNKESGRMWNDSGLSWGDSLRKRFIKGLSKINNNDNNKLFLLAEMIFYHPLNNTIGWVEHFVWKSLVTPPPPPKEQAVWVILINVVQSTVSLNVPCTLPEISIKFRILKRR